MSEHATAIVFGSRLSCSSASSARSTAKSLSSNFSTFSLQNTSLVCIGVQSRAPRNTSALYTSKLDSARMPALRRSSRKANRSTMSSSPQFCSWRVATVLGSPASAISPARLRRALVSRLRSASALTRNTFSFCAVRATSDSARTMPARAMAAAASSTNVICHAHSASSYSSCVLVGRLDALSSGGSRGAPPARCKSIRLPRSFSSADRQLAASGTLRVGLDGRRSCATSQSTNVEMCGSTGSSPPYTAAIVSASGSPASTPFANADDFFGRKSSAAVSTRAAISCVCQSSRDSSLSSTPKTSWLFPTAASPSDGSTKPVARSGDS
mmetsp:Transcript_20117/g.59740  ORF Transcript_20117/g.59740 Transcript_20117/m.59740 type:complete len:326 (+) Transcript_20117:375-1352(+)